VGTFALHIPLRFCASVGLVLTTMTANQASEPIIIVGTDLIPSEADEIELKVQYTVQYRMV
jgi:hypothetical protein